MKKQIIQNIKIIIFALSLVLGVAYVSADWTTAPPNPPLGNVDAPINVGPSSQYKSGFLQISTTTSSFAFSVPNGYSFHKGIIADVNGIFSSGNIVADSGLIVNGSAGIGTNSPTTKLEVVGGAIKATGGLIIETRTAAQGDPASPATGQMWLITN